MRIAGIAVNMVTPKRPALRLCILDDASGKAAVSHSEEISADDVDIVEQLFTVARGVESRLKSLSVDRVIVRRADVPTVASKKDAPRVRLLTEGAAVGASRAAVVETRLAMGIELAHWYGQSKNDLDAAAALLVAGGGKHSKYAEAAAAALAGFQAPLRRRSFGTLLTTHILEIRNADLYAGQPYIVTALAEHGTLDTELAATNGLGVDVDQVVTWMRQASMGVARAHDKSLVHNDIKPANLFLTANKECLVGDFGLASRVPPPPLVGFARGATAETAAPEVRAGWATGHPPADFTTDVYSLGATAYWLLAGQPPVNLAGVKGTAARMSAAAAQTTPRLREVAPHVPASVASIIDRAMAVDPADRYQTVAEFSAALGSRSTKPRRWRRTNEHAGHLGCWRGERPGKSTYVLCLEQGATAKQCTVTTRHSTGAKVPNGSRTAPMRDAAQAVRATIDKLS